MRGMYILYPNHSVEVTRQRNSLSACLNPEALWTSKLANPAADCGDR
jgi:hypothetical protein